MRLTGGVRTRGVGDLAGAKELLGRPFDPDRPADQLLNGIQGEDVIVAGEGDRGPFRPCPAGPADAVDVILRILGQVVVDHVGDALDVQPAGGHVGRDEHGETPLLEIGQDLQAAVLRNVSRERASGIPVGREPFHEVEGRRPPVDEDQDPGPSLALEHS